jgi:hypothetical protein
MSLPRHRRPKSDMTFSKMKVTAEQARATLLNGALRPKTVRVYDARVAAIVRFCEGQGITKARFFLFLYHKSECRMTSKTATGYRCALVRAQKLGEHVGADGHCWAADTDAVKACKGVGWAHGFTPGPPRGAVTSAMLVQMFAAQAAAGTPVSETDQKHFWLIYAGALRREEFTTMRSGDLHHDGVNYFVTLQVDKRCKPGGKHHAQVHRRLVTPGFARLYTQLTDHMAPNEWVLQEHPTTAMNRMNQVIQRSAGLCKWQDGLIFDGVHCLRHGHATDSRYDGALPYRMDSTQQNAMYYARTNDMRMVGKKSARE